MTHPPQECLGKTTPGIFANRAILRAGKPYEEIVKQAEEDQSGLAVVGLRSLDEQGLRESYRKRNLLKARVRAKTRPGAGGSSPPERPSSPAAQSPPTAAIPTLLQGELAHARELAV